jgi:hypothetical protein
MFSTEEGAMFDFPVRPPLVAAALAAFALTLGGCVESRLALDPYHGQALRQDVMAQIADPEARYRGVPQPGSNPDRVGLAQYRYSLGQVIEPASTATSTVQSGSGSNGAGAAPPAPAGK